MSFNLETCRSKDELEAYAKETFGVDLDKREKLDALKALVRGLQGTETPEQPPEPPTTTDTTEAPAPTEYVKNVNTGCVFHYQKQLKKRLGVDLTPCDKNGNAL